MKTWVQKIDAYERLMRLDKPVGILLLLWPTLWGLLIAGQGQPHYTVILIFIVGTILMRSAGCVLNDIADRNFDGHVARTQDRPLATGEVSVREAIILAVVLVLLAFVLVCFLNLKTIFWSVPALFFAATYPYTKRFLAIPQAYLGIAFGMGIPMAFAALQNQVPAVAYWLMLVNVCWSIAYDTEYAIVDRNDDLKIGIRSSALFFGRYVVPAVMICYALMLSILVYLGDVLEYGAAYFSGLAFAVLLIFDQYRLIQHEEREQCFKAFRENNWIGFAIALGILSERGLFFINIH